MISLPSSPLLALALVMTACAGPSGGARARPLAEVPVYRSAAGKRVELDEVLAAIGRADVVVFAEQHGHPTGLALFTALFEESLTRHPGAALCLEFLTRETQHLLDAYAEGLLDWEGLVAACEGVPGSTPEPHRALIDAARGARVPVVAANAPRLYTRAAREHGLQRLASLSAEQQRLYDVPPSTPDEAYRERFIDVMREHVEGGDEEIESLFRAQCLWDATMATSVVQTLASGHRPVFLVVGSFHVNENGGTLQMLRAQRAGLRSLVISVVAEDAQSLAPGHALLADFVAYVGPDPRSD